MDWYDLWEGLVPSIRFPELFSFAKDKNITLMKATITEEFHSLFHLPLSLEAYEQFSATAK